MIEAGQFKPGDKLPSEEALAREMSLSRSTVRQALGYLEAHGMVSRRQGLGTFISKPGNPGLVGGLERLEPFRRLSSRAGLTPMVVDRQVGLCAASARIAETLGIDQGSVLVRVQAVEVIDGYPCMFLDSNILPAVASQEALSSFDGSEIDFLLERAKPRLAYTRSEIFAIGAEGDVPAKLCIPAGTPLLHFVETYFAADSAALGIGFVYFLSEYFHFYISRRAIGR
jgi:GntR family transcriptional regulator